MTSLLFEPLVFDRWRSLVALIDIPREIEVQVVRVIHSTPAAGTVVHALRGTLSSARIRLDVVS